MQADTRGMVGHLGIHEYSVEEMVGANNRSAVQEERDPPRS
jgi:hypothetical protein